MQEIEPGKEVVLTPDTENEVFDKEKADKEEKELKEKKEKKEKPAKPTSLNNEEGGEMEADSESSDEETEDYDTEDEGVDSESSDSSEEEGTVIPDENTMPQIKGDVLAQLGSSGHDC